MKLSLFAATATLALLAPPLAAAEPSFSAAGVRAHVEFLADDLLEGRDTGSRGHRIATAYVASQFDALGLKPGGPGGGWYQTVPMQIATLGAKGARVTIAGPAGSRSWENATEVLVGPSQTERDQSVTAPLVFAGYGITSAPLGIDDYRGLDVRGRIVVVLQGSPTGLPSEIAAHLGSEKARFAEAHGAVGVITVGTTLSLKTRPWAVTVRNAATPRYTWVATDGRANVDAPGVRVAANADGAAAEALFAGAPRTLAAIRAEADRKGGRPAGFALKTTATIERHSDWQRIESPEVIGVLPGTDPKLKGEYVILMAHLDHLGISPARPGDKPDADRINNGALDNAAGVATMLEAARAFVQSGTPPRRSVMFVANTGEEKGLLGADYFAHYPTVPEAQIASVVDLDMPLMLYPFTDVIAFGADHSTLAKAVGRAAESMGVKLSPDPMPEESIFVRSDHYRFVQQGVPAILLATGYANGGAAKWKDFLANYYHSPRDDMNQKIDWNAGARYAELNYRISRELADEDQRSQWYAGDFFGNRYAPNAPKAPADGAAK